jgi:hypothetical protein
MVSAIGLEISPLSSVSIAKTMKSARDDCCGIIFLHIETELTDH